MVFVSAVALGGETGVPVGQKLGEKAFKLRLLRRRQAGQCILAHAAVVQAVAALLEKAQCSLKGNVFSVCSVLISLLLSGLKAEGGTAPAALELGDRAVVFTLIAEFCVFIHDKVSPFV